MLCFGNFAGLGHQQYNIAIAVSSSTFYLPLWERFRHQSDVRGWCRVVFWPCNSNTIFEGKMAQLLRLVKSFLLTPDVSNFGIAYLTILKLNKNKFHFIGTLIWRSYFKHFQFLISYLPRVPPWAIIILLLFFCFVHIALLLFCHYCWPLA